MTDASKPITARRRANEFTVFTLAMLSVCMAPRAWSLDGARIAFGGLGADGAPNIYVTTPEGAGLEQLTFHNGRSDWAWEPAWSPDGRQIAFSSTRKWVTQRIYVMDADAGSQRLISDGADDGHHDYFPTWSPRGHAVAFSSRR